MENEMMGKQEKNRESAMKIMEALSGVDLALLERSDVKVRRKKPVWQYGRTWAAVACVAVVGVLTWRGYNLMDGEAPGNYSGGAMQISSASGTDEKINGEHVSATEMLTGGSDIPEADGVSSYNSAENSGKGNGLPSENQEGLSPSMAPNGSHENSENQDGSTISDSVSEACGIKLQNQKENLTEEEARKKDILGAYIPDSIPKGYKFESSSWYEDKQLLTIMWCKGMDDISFFIQQTEECDTVDIQKPETYDVRLYEIPFGQTVPKEYRTVFDNPVFSWEDFSVEVLESRMYTVEDRGDTNTPRGNFSILFPDGVIVKFTGKATVNQIWEMFQSLGL